MAYAIVPASKPKHKRHHRLGAKAERLMALIDSGLPVPETVIIPPAVVKELDNNKLRLALKNMPPPYIVRSSALSEDGESASFAGLFESFADIQSVERLSEMLHQAASKVPQPVRRYAEAKGARIEELRAWVIQTYKRPLLSGVLFTTDPEDSRRILIEYSDRPQGVTDGSVKPVRLRLDKAHPVLPAPPPFLNQLLQCARAIQEHFGSPQDVEWIYDGSLWIVQTRPITTSPPPLIEETRRLQAKFGSSAPRLSAHQFTESLGICTPVTESLFRSFFAENGSWGMFLRHYRIPYRRYEAETYLPVLWGRLYINKDEERRVLYQAGAVHSSVTYTPGITESIRHPIVSFRRMASATRLRMGTYYGYRRYENRLLRPEPPPENSVAALQRVQAGLVAATVFHLFQASAFQNYTVDVLQRRLFGRVGPEQWERLLRPARPGIMAAAIQEAADKGALLERLGHRGPQELELASPRWSEEPSGLADMAETTTLKLTPSEEILALRRSVISRISGSWDQQMTATHFILYDYFFSCRERAHDDWVRGLGIMRHLLLELDKDASLDGLIWYAELPELYERYPKLDINLLKRRRRARQEFAGLILPTDINGQKWEELLAAGPLVSSSVRSYQIERIVGGQAGGITGSVEDLAEGRPADILLVRSLDPGLVVYFGRIKGILAEAGGLLSHGAILARELGIPTAVLPDALRLISSGTSVNLDAGRERLTLEGS